MEGATNTSTTFTDIGHADKILLKMWKQCESEESCDAVVIAGNKEKRIPVHSSVLSAASEYFDKMFASPTHGILSKEVEMCSVNADILQRLVEYCYTGRVVISEEIVVELLKTAHMLLLVNVVKECENFLTEQVHSSNCWNLALLAEQHGCETLLEKSRCYSLEYFLEVCEMPEFLKLNAEQLRQMFASDDLCVRAEEDVFNSLVRWIEHDPTERVKHLAELLKLVRMSLLERSFLTEHIKPFCASTGCLEIYIEALEGHLSPDSTILYRNRLTKRRKSNQILMAISLSRPDNKTFIHYYCPQRNAWMKWLKGLVYRSAFGVAVMENYLFIVGGYDASGNILNSVASLNLRTMTLEQMPPLNEHRACCRAAALNGTLYVVGGHNNGRALSSVEKWNPHTNQWIVVASLSTDRYNFGIAALNEKLYAVGGYFFDNELSSVECYDPIQNVWQFIESMDEKRQSPGVAVANGMIYAMGGSRRKTVERYDPETNQWTTMYSLHEELITSQSCTSFCDKVVVCYNDRIEEFDAATNDWNREFMSLKQPDDIYWIFSYSNKLLTSDFVKN